MNIGYIRKDDDGHNYLVPEEEISEFDSLMEKLYDDDDALEEFNDKYWKYVINGLRDLKAILDVDDIMQKGFSLEPVGSHDTDPFEDIECLSGIKFYTDQIDKLANYIMDKFPEYIIEGGAIDVAINILEEYHKIKYE